MHACMQTEGLQLVRIRNPWSESDWHGPFADHDQMWNAYPELKEKLGYQVGTKWMYYIVHLGLNVALITKLK
jgi:hypothetical protein